VSVEAISWALNLAPVPPGCGGQPSTACKFVLVGLANYAGPDGTRQSCYAVGLHRCQLICAIATAVTECKVTNLAGGHESRLPAEPARLVVAAIASV
jgi:hypothetical protein